MLGPHRVFPGRLSVSRTIGDVEAKSEQLQGNPKVVICDPDITVVKLEKKHDFLILACDGVFDKIDDKEAVHIVWQSLGRKQAEKNPCGQAASTLIEAAALRQSSDNVTAVVVGFDNFFD